MSETASPAAPPTPETRSRSPIPFLIFLVLLIVGIVFGARKYAESRLYESTDDAFTEGDVVAISAEVAAKILEVPVRDNQWVKKGDLLVRLDASEYQQRLEQAERARKTLEERERASKVQVDLTRETGAANILEGQSGVAAAQAGISTAETGVGAARERQAQAEAAVAEARAGWRRSRTEVDVAYAEVKRLDADLERYRALFAKDEVSRQQLDLVETNDRQARARLDAAHHAVEQVQAQIGQAQAAVATAREGVVQAQAQVEEARARAEEARGRLQVAMTAPRQVQVASQQVKVTRADWRQTESAVELAKLDVDRTRIVAPCDGWVSKKSAEPGSYVQRGSSLCALVPGTQWVVANFKETQISLFKPGLAAEVWVDTYPDKIFKGKIDSLQAGTGARFSLLPPENAAGSFVKVVQRVPVKIVLDEAPSENTPLRPGLSVWARVRLP